MEEREVIYEFERPVEMAIVHRGYIYYTSKNSGEELAGVYRIPIDGGEEELIYTEADEENQLSHLKIIENALIFTEYTEFGDEIYDCLWKYDLEKEEIEKIDLGKDLAVYFASVARERIYYRANKNGKDQTMSTKLDGSDLRKEDFVAHHQDEDYYYEINYDDYTQKVYDWETKEKVAKFAQLNSTGSFFTGKERLFWYRLNDRGGITFSYIDGEDIPKGDAGVKILMDLSSMEAAPSIVTKFE